MKRNALVTTTVIAAIAVMALIGCSGNNPTAPSNDSAAQLASGPGSFGNGESGKPSYDVQITGNVIKTDVKNSVFVLEKGEQIVIVTPETKARFLPIIQQIPFDFGYLKAGLTVTVYGSSKSDGAIVAALVDLKDTSPTSDPIPSAL